jgi:hypothetical protein
MSQESALHHRFVGQHHRRTLWISEQRATGRSLVRSLGKEAFGDKFVAGELKFLKDTRQEWGMMDMSQDKAVRLRCLMVNGFSRGMIRRTAYFMKLHRVEQWDA